MDVTDHGASNDDRDGGETWLIRYEFPWRWSWHTNWRPCNWRFQHRCRTS